jgi:hypothetical protein
MGVTQIPTVLATIYSRHERYWAGIKDRGASGRPIGQPLVNSRRLRDAT